MPEIYEDIPRIYTAIAEWSSCMIFCLVRARKGSVLRFSVGAAVFLSVLSVFLVLTANVPVIFWLLCMLAAFGIMYAFIYSSIYAAPKTVLYYTLRAFLVAEFAASLEWQLSVYGDELYERSVPLRTAVLVVVYTAVFFAAYRFEKRVGTDGPSQVYSLRDILTSGFIVAVTFAISNLSFLSYRTPFSTVSTTDILILRTIVDFGGLAALYALQSRINEMQAANEIAQMSKAFETQYEGYRNYQEMIGLINFKYHDLKHQVAGLLAEHDPDKREHMLLDMQGELEKYRPEHITGNQVLDTILAGKSMRIKQTGIRFTCVADGSLLSVIHVSDICSIFGNALDNAIEYEATLPEPSDRIIHLTVAKRQGYIFIECANYCSENLAFDNGLPVTTKSDRKTHGYGVKSIVYSVSKYKGNVSFRQRDNMFIVQILIPERS